MRIWQSETDQGSPRQRQPQPEALPERAKGAIPAFVRDAFHSAGVELNGTRPFDPRVKDPRFYARVLTQGSLGLGETYVDGLWECDALDELCLRLLRGGLADRVPLVPAALLRLGRRVLTNAQRIPRAALDVRAHYDQDSALYQAMLDPRMVYSCGYWRNVTTLEEAQEAKLELICRKLGLQAGQTVLDIGCGWGSFARYAAEKYGVHVFGVTLSPKQVELGRELCRGLPVELHVLDYRSLHGAFDHVVSVGMMEHVGVKNYRSFFEVVDRCLKPTGLFLLHTIGARISTLGFDPWLDCHVFPGAQLPSLAQLAQACESRFIVEDLHNFGADYDRTLLAWRDNFERNWGSLQSRHNDRFRRLWRYYLSICAGTFRARVNQLYQIVLSKKGVEGGYRSVR